MIGENALYFCLALILTPRTLIFHMKILSINVSFYLENTSWERVSTYCNFISWQFPFVGRGCPDLHFEISRKCWENSKDPLVRHSHTIMCSLCEKEKPTKHSDTKRLIVYCYEFLTLVGSSTMTLHLFQKRSRSFSFLIYKVKYCMRSCLSRLVLFWLLTLLPLGSL